MKYSLTIHTDNVEEIRAAIAAAKECAGDCGASHEAISNLDSPATITIPDATALVEFMGKQQSTAAAAVTDSAPVTAEIAPIVDSAGLPWDARINASTKTTKADGTWKAKKGVDAAEKLRVEAELRGGTVTTPEVDAFAAKASQESQPFSTPAQQAGSVFAPAAVQGGVSFASVFTTVSARVNNPADSLTEGTVKAICLNFGINSLVDLNARPDLIDAVWSELSKY